MTAVRTCGTCTMCCKLPAIDWPNDRPVGRPALKKPGGVLCTYCVEGKGCTIYPDRPISCAGFHCLWLMGMMPEALSPEAIGGFFDVQGRLLLVADPERPHPLDNPRVSDWVARFKKLRHLQLSVVRGKEESHPKGPG